MRSTFLPFALPDIDQAELDQVKAVLESGWITTGPKTRAFEARFAEKVCAKHAVAVNSATAAMHLSLEAIGLQRDDEVITTPYTFAATAEVVRYFDAKPVLVDVGPYCLNIDPAGIERAITPRTRAIIPVHVGCTLADMDAIRIIAHRYSLLIIEDAAHAHGSKWGDKGAGSLGHFGSFSLQSSKTLTTGEGGILLTNDDALAETARSLIDCGRPKDAAESHYNFGANFRMGELQCALGVTQISRLEKQTELRAGNMGYLSEALSEIPGVTPLQPYAQTTLRPTYRYIFKIHPEAFAGVSNARFCEALSAEGIDAWRGWDPMYRYSLFKPTPQNSPVARNFPNYFAFDKMHLPEIERASTQEAVWLDMEYFMSDRAIMDDIVEAVNKIRQNAHELATLA